MNYYHLRSIVAAGKKRFEMRVPSDSFNIPADREEPYIEPTFSKVLFEGERPPIILISAVGATGKSALAQVMSNQTGLPLLDLAKHKPVGDNTLTGLLTSSFNVQDLSAIFEGVATGSFGVLIDGIDEGRSKTTEKAFEAFLDDIARLSSTATNTSVVLLGRSQILDDCWTYFNDKGIEAWLVTISPFSLEQATEYIDSYSGAIGGQFFEQYQGARDLVLAKLAAAFSTGGKDDNTSFLSFIGYPPVLDSIVTLLVAEKNYFKLVEEIKNTCSSDVEILLLHRIALYILEREKEQKVKPNILDPLVAQMSGEDGDALIKDVFDIDEQCIRLLAHCMGKSLALSRIPVRLIDDKYEEQLANFLPEHPFLHGGKFRNAVFESMALAVAMKSELAGSTDLAVAYCGAHKHSYHLIYLLKTVMEESPIAASFLPVVIASSMEFKSANMSVELNISGPELEDEFGTTANDKILDIEIEIKSNAAGQEVRTFEFKSDINEVDVIHIGSRLASTFISVPCDVEISGGPEIEITAPTEIFAKGIALRSTSLVLKRYGGEESDASVLLDCNKVQSTLESIVPNAVPLTLSVADTAGLAYPAINYVVKKDPLPQDPLLREKYFRLKRILLEFRSHSKGSLAKYKNKIEHERVLKNETGRAILRKLLSDGILVPEGVFYHVKPEAVDKHLEISWHDLRCGRTSATMLSYLRAIE